MATRLSNRAAFRFPLPEESSGGLRFRGDRWVFDLRACAVSLAMHLLLAGLMACIVWDLSGRFGDDEILATLADAGDSATPFETDPSDTKLAAADQPAQELLQDLTRNLPSDQSAEELPEPNLTPNPEAESTADESPDVDSPSEAAAASEAAETDGPSAPKGPKITAGRSGPMKGKMLTMFGGTAETESAVNLGLAWLAKQQTKDGSWSFVGPYPDGASFTENRMAATSMSLLAFLGAGHTHKSGDYQKEVDSALRWMVSRQKRAGAMGAGTPPHHTLYTHAQATLALSEAYAMTEDPWLKPYCQSALEYAAKSQGPQGGWRYEYKGDSDTSVTGWMMMALVSGKSAGLYVPDRNLQKIRGWLDIVGQEYGELYSYMPGRAPTPSMTAEGLLCRMYLGWPRTTSAIDRGVERLLTIAPMRVQDQTYYYWYYATQVMHHVGGPAWETWNEAMKEQLPAIQVRQGPDAGSWPPGGRMLDRMPGRLYATCMSLYCLEVYYRHLPIYESPWGKAAIEP